MVFLFPDGVLSLFSRAQVNQRLALKVDAAGAPMSALVLRNMRSEPPLWRGGCG